MHCWHFLLPEVSRWGPISSDFHLDSGKQQMIFVNRSQLGLKDLLISFVRVSRNKQQK
jgi:hypothetical protein